MQVYLKGKRKIGRERHTKSQKANDEREREANEFGDEEHRSFRTLSR